MKFLVKNYGLGMDLLFTDPMKMKVIIFFVVDFCVMYQIFFDNRFFKCTLFVFIKPIHVYVYRQEIPGTNVPMKHGPLWHISYHN